MSSCVEEAPSTKQTPAGSEPGADGHRCGGQRGTSRRGESTLRWADSSNELRPLWRQRWSVRRHRRSDSPGAGRSRRVGKVADPRRVPGHALNIVTVDGVNSDPLAFAFVATQGSLCRRV